MKYLVSVITFLLYSSFYAQNIKVTTLSEYDTAIKQCSSGGTIILQNGVWKDVKLVAHGNGTKEKPIIIKAETAGEVILTGDSSLSISGSFVTVSGLWFKEGKTSAKYVVQFRKNSKEFANNCRFTNSTISYYETTDAVEKNHWIDLWGKNNRVDHNNFTGKVSAGTTVVVWLKGEAHTENKHRIDHNYFGHRPELGQNGGETIRIGTSANSMKSSQTIVEKNVFKRCNGEIEIISNKSFDNVYRNNLFLESEGTLTLRHGNNALVENNVFLGNNKPKTGGIRIINSGHIVRNNLLVGLTGKGLRGPIVMMNGIPNSPINRYHQVKNVDVQNNTIINCGSLNFGAGKDDEITLPPIQSVFANNIITNTNAGKIADFTDSVDGITFSGNIVDSQASINPEYFTKATIDWTLLKSLPVPSENNPILKNVSKTGKSPNTDINDVKRETYVAGAFNLNTSQLPRILYLKAGPGWTPKIVAPIRKPKNIFVAPGIGTLSKAIKKAKDGDLISLKAGVYQFDKNIRVSKNIQIIGAENGETTFVMQEDITKSFTYFFRVNEGGNLHLKNITLDGDHKNPPKYAIVSPDKMQSGLYMLNVENCTFKNFKNTDGGSIFKAYTGTFAESLIFSNCTFSDSYRGLNLSYDKNNMGKYNAKSIRIDNCVFKKIKQFAVNYIRSIPSLDIEGGKLIITNCVFDKVANYEKGYVIRSKGIHEVSIQNSVFMNSYSIQKPLQLEGKNSMIRNCLFQSNGFPKVSKGATKEALLFKNPKWDNKAEYIPSKKSPLLKVNNGIADIGLKQ